jgi:hypothetical protein
MILISQYLLVPPDFATIWLHLFPSYIKIQDGRKGQTVLALGAKEVPESCRKDKLIHLQEISETLIPYI